MRLTSTVSFALVCATALAASPRPAAAQSGVSPQLRAELLASLERGAAFLMSQRKADGIWENHPGISALAATALLRQTGKTPAAQYPGVASTLEYLKGLQKPDGGIYIRDLPHYITAVAAMAFVASERPEYRPAIEKARAFLVEHMIDEGEGYTPNDKFYGGLGYGSDLRPDLVNLEYGLRALKETGLAKDDAAWNKALKFLQRSQNHTETNDMPGVLNDGGFMYYPGFTYAQGGGTHSYGSMTYAGVLSYAYANLSKDDQRVKAALSWIRDNYTVDENPGVGQMTLYYYYMVFAKALSTLGEDVIVDSRGQRHNWREDLGRKLLSLQHSEGYWVNADPREWQNNKVLVTSFTMMAIEYLLQPAGKAS